MLGQKGRVSGTVIFTILVVGLAAYVFFFEFMKEKNKEKEKDKEALVFSSFSLPDITGVVVSPNFVNKDTDIKIEKKDGEWRILTPINDLADKYAVETYVSTLLEEKSQESLGKVEDLQVLGLNVPKGTVSFKTSNNEIHVNIGSVKAYDGSYYALISNKAGAFLVSSIWDSLISKKPNDFRDKRVERSEFKNWTRVVTKSNGKPKVELIKDGETWQLVPHSEIPVDSELVKGFIDQMVTLEIQDFLSETKTDLAPYGLNTPDYELQLSGEHDGKLKTWKLALSSQKAQERFANATSSDLSGVVKVHEAALDVVARPREAFYNRKFPFQYDVTQAARIKIQTPEVKLIAAKKDGRWLKEESSNGLDVIHEKMDELAAALSRLEAAYYLNEKGKDLAPAKNFIEVMSASGEVLTRFVWGEEYKPKTVDAANTGLQFYFAQTSKLPKQTLAIKQNVVHDLNLAHLFNEPAAESTPSPTPAL